jgi:hypothetical protein
MSTAHLHFESWRLAWRGLWRKLAPRCGRCDRLHARSLWRRWRGKKRGVVIQGSWYCLEGCLEQILSEALTRTRSTAKHSPGSHRIPLGLLLLSRQQLTPGQLRRALAAQRSAGRGRIGEWLQNLGFVSEQQITAALARQWACPVLRLESLPSAHLPQIPLALLETFAMLPVVYVPATTTLHVAFADRIEYGVLYAVEQMLQCRTEPCLAPSSQLRSSLRELAGRRAETEILFEQVADVSEFARIVRSYSARVAASEIRLASCGSHIWVRLLRRANRPLDLVLRCPREAALSPVSAMPGVAPAV